MHRDMAQRADRVGIEHGLGALPAHDLMEIEIDHGRRGSRRLPQHGARIGEIAGHRLFGEYRLAEFERRIAICACRLGSVAMATACTSLSSTSARQSP